VSDFKLNFKLVESTNLRSTFFVVEKIVGTLIINILVARNGAKIEPKQ
jgi:hypothetical protein